MRLSRSNPRSPLGDYVVRFADRVRGDRLIYALVAAYYCVAGALGIAHGRSIAVYLQVYLVNWTATAVSVVALIACAKVAVAVFVRRSRRPLRVAGKIVRRFLSPEALGGLPLFLALCAFMAAFTTLKTILPQLRPFWADPALASLGHAIHMGRDSWQLLQPVLGHPMVTRVIEVCYTPVWLAVVAATPLLISLYCRDERLRSRFLLTFLLAWVANGTVVAGLFMSGGPAYYGELTGDVHRFAGLLEYLRRADGGPQSAIAIQQVLWNAQAAGGPSPGMGISAFPSLHVTMSVLVFLVGRSIDRRLGIALGLFAITIFVGSIHLGWHYALDGYFAIASTLAYWWAVGRLQTGRRSARRSAPGPVLPHPA